MKNVLIALVVIVLVVGAGVGVYNYLEMPHGYTATATFERQVGKPPAPGTADPLGLAGNHARIERLVMNYDFESRDTLEQLIKNVDQLHRDLMRTDEGTFSDVGRAQYEQLFVVLQKAISVSVERRVDGSEIVRIDVTMEDGHLAADIANTLVETYLKKVRTETDDALIAQKKFFSGEATRYRRKLSELETQELRFMATEILPGVSNAQWINNPAMLQNHLNALSQLEDEHAKLIAKIKYLTDSFADRAIPDQAVIQLAEWKAERDVIDTKLKDRKVIEADLKAVNRRYFELNNEWQKIKRDTVDAKEQLAFWNDRLQRVQVALTMAVSERGMRLRVIQSAAKPPAKQKPRF